MSEAVVSGGAAGILIQCKLTTGTDFIPDQMIYRIPGRGVLSIITQPL